VGYENRSVSEVNPVSGATCVVRASRARAPCLASYGCAHPRAPAVGMAFSRISTGVAMMSVLEEAVSDRKATAHAKR
jgi:hypothetical protein